MVDVKTIEKIASLSRLEITSEEAFEFSQQLGRALQYFEQIAKVDTNQIEPMITPIEIENKLREDIVEHTISVDKILQNAPETQGHLFKVPPVV